MQHNKRFSVVRFTFTQDFISVCWESRWRTSVPPTLYFQVHKFIKMETEFDPGDEWRDILRLLYIINLLFKIIHLIGKCLMTVAEFFINQTGSSSNDEPIKIAGEDTQLNFLQLTLEDITILTNQLPFLATEEFEMARKWRNLSEEVTNLHIEYELGLKTSYTYLLLDPEISNNLPRRQYAIPLQEAWRTFIRSVFYVGR